MTASLAMVQKKCLIGTGQETVPWKDKAIILPDGLTWCPQKEKGEGKHIPLVYSVHSPSQRLRATSKEITEPFGMKPYLCRVWERDSKRDCLVFSPWKRQIQTRRPFELQRTDAALLEVCSPHVWALSLAVSSRNGACPIRAPIHTGGPRALCSPWGRSRKQMECHMPA